MTERRIARRILLCSVCLIVALAGLGARLAYLHLGEHEGIREQVRRTRHVRRTLTGRRGDILERRGPGCLMALDMAVKNVCADPMKIAEQSRMVDVASALSEALNLPTDEVAVRLSNTSRRFSYVQRFVPTEEADRIRAMKLSGVFFEDDRIRFYPHKNTLCHVLGFVNREGVGSAGIEQGMERFLRGTPGYVESEVNALRQEVYLQRIRQIPSVEGADVTLTIDENVQFVVEKALDAAMDEHRPKGAWAIVQRVKTGEILAMGSRPAFDPNRFFESDEDARLNRAIGYTYEPGSTFKALTVAAALNEGTVTPQTAFDCEHGMWFYGGKPLRDFHPYGVLTVADGLQKSSNILAAKVALTLGDKRFHEYIAAFGIGTRAGIELPGEEGGILHPTRNWSKIEATRIAMGHSVAVTALQMLGAFCAIANDGVLMKPYVIAAVTAKDGTELYRAEPTAVGRPITPDTALTMRRLLARVTEEGGTGKRARVENYEVAGKTGTSEKLVDGQYSSQANIASFVGFLPAAKPELGIIVVVDEPSTHHTGGRVAAPFFNWIATESVRYLDIAPPTLKLAESAGGREFAARSGRTGAN